MHIVPAVAHTPHDALVHYFILTSRINSHRTVNNGGQFSFSSGAHKKLQRRLFLHRDGRASGQRNEQKATRTGGQLLRRKPLCVALLSAHDRILNLATDELAIALLDDLTSPTIWPYPYVLFSRLMRGHSKAITSRHHIRQILYLSLYPVDLFIKEAQKSKKSSGNALVPPSPEGVSAAVDLLNSFLITLPASVILKALPSYDSRIDYRPGPSDHYPLASAATAICSAQNCWEFLKPGFLQQLGAARTNKISSVPPSPVPAPVAENAWPVLEWLVAVLERASEIHPLLSQIPPTTSGPRFSIEAIMDVIFHGFADPANHRRVAIGERLSNMVSNHFIKPPSGRELTILCS